MTIERLPLDELEQQLEADIQHLSSHPENIHYSWSHYQSHLFGRAGMFLGVDAIDHPQPGELCQFVFHSDSPGDRRKAVSEKPSGLDCCGCLTQVKRGLGWDPRFRDIVTDVVNDDRIPSTMPYSSATCEWTPSQARRFLEPFKEYQLRIEQRRLEIEANVPSGGFDHG